MTSPASSFWPKTGEVDPVAYLALHCCRSSLRTEASTRSKRPESEAGTHAFGAFSWLMKWCCPRKILGRSQKRKHRWFRGGGCSGLDVRNGSRSRCTAWVARRLPRNANQHGRCLRAQGRKAKGESEEQRSEKGSST